MRMTRSVVLRPRLVTNVFQALRVRRLRNTCRAYLTNYRDAIGVRQQIRWFYGSYRKMLQAGEYRIYLYDDGPSGGVGYGALHLQDGRLYITECVAPAQRGRGVGRAILAHLLDTARRQRRAVVAEIWADNAVSIALHTRAGFKLASTRQHHGRDLHVYTHEG
jgi:RimJ/RimL family protein N-acetyltransferase